MKEYCWLIGVLIFSVFTKVNAQQYTLSGYLRDAATGEDLVFANIYDKNAPINGVTTNMYGFYSLTLKAGTYSIVASYTGYVSNIVEINLQGDTTIDIRLSDGVSIDSVIVVTAERGDANIESTEMGTVELDMAAVRKLPALMGEVDVLKTIQLLPGVLSSGEGTSGFYVRGGGVDQNLILLDEAVVYNSGHLLGFFSVFNSDAIKRTTLIKGGMPANYGGRLSSVLDIQMKEGNKKRFAVQGGIGLVSSKLTFEGPFANNKASFMISGRRTYLFDIAQPFLKGTSFEGTNYYFYDLNLKANAQITRNDRLFLSGYFGRDVLNLKNPDRGFDLNMPWGNATGTLRWNHLFNDKLFMNTLFVYNEYDFSISGGQQDFQFKLNSGIQDWGTKVSFDYYPNPRHQVKFGLDYTYHILTPNRAEAFSGGEGFEILPEPKYAHEIGTYISDKWKINTRLSINYGIRFSAFQQVGPYIGKVNAGNNYAILEPVKTYYGVEPRFNGKYSLSPKSSVKLGVTMGRQYLHLVSNSTSTLPGDLWVPSTEIVAPQWGMQYAGGYFHNFLGNMLEASVEVYYKDLYNQLDYSESYIQDPNTDIEDEFIAGKGRAYGAEFFLRKQKGALTGWIAYTLSKSERIFEGIKGRVYPSGFDRTHDLSVVAAYDITKRMSVSATFILGSGAPYTPIKSVYLMNLQPTLEYGLRNSARLPLYHRADCSVSYKLNKKERPFESTLVLSIYNIYNRKNVFFTYTDPQTDALSGAVTLNSYQVSLFPIIPSISWNFKWSQSRRK